MIKSGSQVLLKEKYSLLSFPVENRAFLISLKRVKLDVSSLRFLSLTSKTLTLTLKT
jgi:hypothetical protein